MGPVPTEEERAAALAARAETQGTTIAVGRNLYDVNQPYLFPFEVTSILLLVAVIGSVVLAKRRMPGENLGSMRSDTFDGTGEAN